MMEPGINWGRRIDPSVRHLIWGILAILVSGWLLWVVMVSAAKKGEWQYQEDMEFYWVLGAFIFAGGAALSALAKSWTPRVLGLVLFPLVFFTVGRAFSRPFFWPDQTPPWLLGLVFGLAFPVAVMLFAFVLENVVTRVRPRKTIAQATSRRP